MTDNIKCTNCGAPVDSAVTSCPFCNTALSSTKHIQAEAYKEPEDEDDEEYYDPENDEEQKEIDRTKKELDEEFERIMARSKATMARVDKLLNDDKNV